MKPKCACACWMLLAPFTGQICVSNSFTVLHWLQFCSLQRSALKASTWLMLVTKVSLAKYCLFPETCYSLQDPCMAPGISAFACALTVVATVPFLEVCVVAMCCELLCSTLDSRLSSLILSTSHSWSMEIPDSSLYFHTLTYSSAEKLAGQKQARIILLFAAIYNRVWLWCYFQSFSISWGVMLVHFGDNLDWGQAKSWYISEIFYYSFLLM